MNEILSWVVPLTSTITLGSVAWLIKLAIDYTSVKKDLEVALRDIDRLEKGFEENKGWNRNEHEKLYNSRNDLEKIIIRFEGILKTMDEKIQEILERERAKKGE